ncbi:hypothetical protein ASG92_16920 [Arthrobacter sp. Soil736]|nr:hypothetical protein ASG92_16920 [Arthrobacter sp. Soil736]
MAIDVPLDTGSTFDPQIVRKRQRRLAGVDEIVLSLSAKGLTTGEIAAHFGEVFGVRVSKDTISRITEKVIGEMTEWQNRPLDRGRFLMIVANPRKRAPHAQIRVEQDAAGGETPVLRTDPSRALRL